MAIATISNSGGPGSSVQLAPKTIQVRDAIIAKCADQTLEEMNEFVKSLLAGETDELKRLGILAARVYILRERISIITQRDTVNSPPPLSADKEDEVASAPSPAEDGDAGDEAAASDWINLRIIKDCEVNGIRFPSGLIVDVRSEDAIKLIEVGNAERVTPEPAATPNAELAADSVADSIGDSNNGSDDGLATSPASEPVSDAGAEPIVEPAKTDETDNMMAGLGEMEEALAATVATINSTPLENVDVESQVTPEAESANGEPIETTAPDPETMEDSQIDAGLDELAALNDLPDDNKSS